MPLFDLPLDQLRNYSSTAIAPVDFDDFWDRTIVEARGLPLNAVFEPVDNYLSVINTFDVTFSGFGGDRIKGWLHLPAQLGSGEHLPVVVEYIGYSGGRGLVNQNTRWAQAGCAHFIMDTRGQGYGGVSGDTPDPHPSAGGVNYAGLMTRGADHQDNYYFRRVYVDAFRAVEAAQSHPAVDPSRVVLTGVSQGGGITIAAAGLAAGRLDGVIAALPDVPFLQDFPRAIDITPRGPYPEIAGLLGRHREKYGPMLAVLNYFDGVHLGRAATVPALFSAAQMDDICPPSTVFASFNNYGTGVREQGGAPEKNIEVYRFNNHEGGQEHHWIKQLQFLRKLLSS
ncbi:acetylxylan esterase [Arthrobacter sp. MYb23]|uniref:acetylxylan esterase n=1 Tax=unclassified Arthrobacter TaxID=235627 RepID=UPI000CFC3CAE|nr:MULTISPECIES: acetylxylan esterase [unclassified Arthrobacter]PRB44900.1 acetylxylan esterase [Arthrobacter sp. MYb51]PRB99637.1 acetylxylan esterase [Arthrobacter sp. MYb23]